MLKIRLTYYFSYLFCYLGHNYTVKFLYFWHSYKLLRHTAHQTDMVGVDNLKSYYVCFSYYSFFFIKYHFCIFVSDQLELTTCLLPVLCMIVLLLWNNQPGKHLQTPTRTKFVLLRSNGSIYPLTRTSASTPPYTHTRNCCIHNPLCPQPVIKNHCLLNVILITLSGQVITGLGQVWRLIRKKLSKTRYIKIVCRMILERSNLLVAFQKSDIFLRAWCCLL